MVYQTTSWYAQMIPLIFEVILTKVQRDAGKLFSCVDGLRFEFQWLSYHVHNNILQLSLPSFLAISPPRNSEACSIVWNDDIRRSWKS